MVNMKLDNYFRSKLEGELIASKNMAREECNRNKKEIYELIQLYKYYSKYFNVYGTYRSYKRYRWCSMRIRELMRDYEGYIVEGNSKLDINVRKIRSVWMKYYREETVFKRKNINKFYNIISSIRTKYWTQRIKTIFLDCLLSLKHKENCYLPHYNLDLCNKMGIRNLFIYLKKKLFFSNREINEYSRIRDLNLKYPFRLIPLKHIKFNYDRLLGSNIVSLVRKNLILLRKEISWLNRFEKKVDRIKLIYDKLKYRWKKNNNQATKRDLECGRTNSWFEKNQFNDKNFKYHRRILSKQHKQAIHEQEQNTRILLKYSTKLLGDKNKKLFYKDLDLKVLIRKKKMCKIFFKRKNICRKYRGRNNLFMRPKLKRIKFFILLLLFMFNNLPISGIVHEEEIIIPRKTSKELWLDRMEKITREGEKDLKELRNLIRDRRYNKLRDKILNDPSNKLTEEEVDKLFKKPNIPDTIEEDEEDKESIWSEIQIIENSDKLKIVRKWLSLRTLKLVLSALLGCNLRTLSNFFMCWKKRRDLTLSLLIFFSLCYHDSNICQDTW